MNPEISQNKRIDFMKKSAFYADKSSCLYKIGCVGVISKINLSDTAKKSGVVKNSKSLTYIKSYNETLPGEIYCSGCDKFGKRMCIRVEENLKGRDFQKVCSIHAEVNLISICARFGISTQGMIMFVTNSPCYVCAKAIIKAGISEVCYMSKHTDITGIDLLMKNNIKCTQLSHEVVFS